MPERTSRNPVHLWRLPSLILVVAFALIPMSTPAYADTSTATPISAIPYSDSIDLDTTPADTEATECTFGWPTAWYTYTATGAQALAAVLSGTDDDYVSVFTGTPGSFDPLVCGVFLRTQFTVAAGQTVYIAVAGFGADTTFRLDVPPPPLDVNLTLDDTARLGLPGAVTVSGTVTCNAEAQAEISGTIRQQQGHTVVRGDLFTVVPCSTTPTSWTATADTGSRALLTKAATLSVAVSACDGFTCDSASTTRTVRVLRK
jgi:hypothetical protein